MSQHLKPIISNRKIKWAIIGCGRISKNHFSALKKFSEDIELVAVCDTIPERADAAVEENSAPAFYSLTELLKNCDLDIVSLCTPSGIHPQQAIECSQSGIHVVSEKPIGTRLSQGIEMVQACKKNNVHLFVVKQNRFNPTIQKVKEALQTNRFGKIYFAQVNVFWTRPQDYYDQAKWRGTRELDGGALMNQASHYVDLLTWLIGQPSQVVSFTSTLARKIEMEDTATVSLQWPEGTLGSLNVTMLTYPQNLEGSLTILGEKGTVKIGGIAVNEVLNWEFSDGKDHKEEIQDASYKTDSVYGFGHPAYYQNVIKTLRGDISALACNGEQGLKSLELLEAIYRSAESKKIITLPLEP